LSPRGKLYLKSDAEGKLTNKKEEFLTKKSSSILFEFYFVL
jgi:hypothetical protein